MKKLTAAWVRKAEADFAIARRESGANPPVHDGVCFHCQQAAEKYLKALLQEQGNIVPRTHSLHHLLALLLPRDGDLKALHRGLRMMGRFAVDVRYPEFNATKRQASAALRCAERVRREIRARRVSGPAVIGRPSVRWMPASHRKLIRLAIGPLS
jgi:HEPN domain-containing protein